MADSMAIGPAVSVGGNKVQMEVTPKFTVTDKKGKTETFNKDEFQRQLELNADKLESGEDFELKKDRKGLKIVAIAAGTAAVVTGIIYYKKIGQFFNKLFKKVKPNKEKDVLQSKRYANYSARQAQIDAHKDFLKNAETINLSKQERQRVLNDARDAFENYTQEQENQKLLETYFKANERLNNLKNYIDIK